MPTLAYLYSLVSIKLSRFHQVFYCPWTSRAERQLFPLFRNEQKTMLAIHDIVTAQRFQEVLIKR